MNILLSAYACEPDCGSEPEVGWKMANEIANIMQNDTIYVITKKNNRDIIEKENLPSNLNFFYYELPKYLSFWKKGGRGIRTYYYLWMIGAVLYIKSKNIKFDIIHHITFVNDWLPSFFFLLKNTNNKFIWGPIGSHDPIDTKFLDGKKRKIIETIRISLQLLFRKLDPFFHLCKHRADCIVGINDNVNKKLNLNKSKYFIVEPAISIDKEIISKNCVVNKSDHTFKIVTVGRLLYIKNFKLTLLVFSRFLKNNPEIANAKLQIVGDGVDRKSLELLAGKLGISKHVEFMGRIPLDEVQQQLSVSDIFLFPTLENAGFVILEAMSNALPILAMNYGGPQQFILHNKNVQLVSPSKPYDFIVDSLATNLERLYKDKHLRLQVGELNRMDVLDNYTWQAKAEKMKKIYKEVIHEA